MHHAVTWTKLLFETKPLIDTWTSLSQDHVLDSEEDVMCRLKASDLFGSELKLSIKPYRLPRHQYSLRHQ